MKLSEQQSKLISFQFRNVRTVAQLAELLQAVYILKFPQKNKESSVQINTRDLTYQAFVNKERYKSFGIAKKSGGIRSITTPNYKLKTIQKCLNEVLASLFISHKASFGFVVGKSVVDNARIHVSRNYVYNIDLKDFFSSISFRRVKTVLELPPYNLSAEKEPLAFLIANLCCHNGSLPQGAPTSPILSNIVCQRLDRKLYILSKKHKAFYSRYADDITFSSRFDVFNSNFKSELLNIISVEENFEVNPLKERKADWRTRQEVTGIIVNQKTNVSREFIKDIRYWLRTWKKFGLEKTQKDFKQRYTTKKGYLRSIPFSIYFYDYLFGKIQYLGMVRGLEDELYFKFKKNYYLLLEGIKPEVSKKDDFLRDYKFDFTAVFDEWSNQYHTHQDLLKKLNPASRLNVPDLPN